VQQQQQQQQRHSDNGGEVQSQRCDSNEMHAGITLIYEQM